MKTASCPICGVRSKKKEICKECVENFPSRKQCCSCKRVFPTAIEHFPDESSVKCNHCIKRKEDNSLAKTEQINRQMSDTPPASTNSPKQSPKPRVNKKRQNDGVETVSQKKKMKKMMSEYIELKLGDRVIGRLTLETSP